MFISVNFSVLSLYNRKLPIKKNKKTVIVSIRCRIESPRVFRALSIFRVVGCISGFRVLSDFGTSEKIVFGILEGIFQSFVFSVL
jgi:hypothetical protein